MDDSCQMSEGQWKVEQKFINCMCGLWELHISLLPAVHFHNKGEEMDGFLSTGFHILYSIIISIQTCAVIHINGGKAHTHKKGSNDGMKIKFNMKYDRWDHFLQIPAKR